jgi:hypothetical protein
VISKRELGRRAIAVLGAAIVVACFAPAAVAAPRSSHGSGSGLWLVTATGRVVALGGAPTLSAADSWTRRHVVVAAAGTSTGGGMWLLAVDGSVLPVGDAASFGPVPPARTLTGRAVGIAATPDGGGYLVAYADGRVEAGGDAVARGNASLPRGIGHEIAGIAITPTGQGYWLVGLDGHVYAFGDAPAFAPMRLGPFDALVTAVAATPTGRGLWIGSADGHVTALGDAAPLLPSSRPLHGLLTGLAATPSGRGLWLASLTGTVEARGDAAPIASNGIVLPVVAAVASAPTGTLTVNVTELPTGAAGAVTVTGSSAQYAVPATETLRVAPGDYAVNADAVHAAHTTYRPTITGSPASVAPGGSATATVDYLWAIPDTTKHVVSSAVEDATGDPTTGLTLTLDPASAPSLAVGNIVVIGITDSTPYGWLGKVTAVSSSAGALTVTTIPVSLFEAVTRGSIDAHWSPDGNTITDGSTSVRTTQAHARSQGLIDLSNIAAQIPQNLSCGGSASVGLNGGISLSGDVDFEANWSSPLSINRVELNSRLVAKATAGFTASAAANCTLDPTAIAEFALPLGDAFGFVITLKLELDVSAGISVAGAVSTSATATEQANLGAAWDPTDGVIPIHHFDQPVFTQVPPAPNADADAWVKIGPKATVLVDGLAGPYFNVNAGLDFSADTSQDPWWKLDATLDSNLGFSIPYWRDFGLFMLFDQHFPLLQATEPPPTGSGGDGGDGGNGGDNGNGGNPPPPAYCFANPPVPLMPGGSVPFEGRDFAPNETVHLALDGGGGSLGTASTDGSGSFSTTVTIPSNATGGDRSIVGTGAAGNADDTCNVTVTVYTGPPPGSATAGEDDGSYASSVASAPRTIEQLGDNSPSWPHLPADVLPGDVLFAVTTAQDPVDAAPGWTTADVEGATVVSYLVVPSDPSTVDLSGLGGLAVVTVVRDVDPTDPVATHTIGAGLAPGPFSFTTPFAYTFNDPAYCPAGADLPCRVTASPSVITDSNWATPQVSADPGQGLLGWAAYQNSSFELAYASCGNLPTLTCPYPAWNYGTSLLLSDSFLFPLASGSSSDFTGYDEYVYGPSGDPTPATVGASAGFDSTFFCEPRGPYAVDEGTEVAQDSPIGPDGNPQPCHRWYASPASLGALVLNPRQPGTGPDDSPPTTPGGITAGVGARIVDLSWQQSSDDTGVIGYAVFRNGAWIATVTGSPQFSDENVAPFTPYHYAVVAIDGFGNHSRGATMDVVTQLDDGGGGA